MLNIELIALYAFALVLPMFEAPKNLLWIIYAVLWIANRSRTRDFGGPWTAWDTLISAWIVSGYAAAAFAGLHNNEWLSAFDILRYGSILLFLKRSRYEPVALQRLLTCIAIGTAAALARGAYEHWVTKQHDLLGLNSKCFISNVFQVLDVLLMTQVQHWLHMNNTHTCMGIHGNLSVMFCAYLKDLVNIFGQVFDGDRSIFNKA